MYSEFLLSCCGSAATHQFSHTKKEHMTLFLWDFMYVDVLKLVRVYFKELIVLFAVLWLADQNNPHEWQSVFT